jgi:membrane protease YdiL (CAAX protease family)
MKLKIKENWKYIIAAIWMPILLSVLGAVLYYIFFPNKFSFELQYISERLKAKGANEVNVRVYVLMQVLSAITVAPFINMLFAIGEEVGWRGFMTPLLMRKYGVKSGNIIGGTIWGIWHWPLIIFTGYQYGSGYWGAPYTGMSVMLLFAVSLGTFLTYLYSVSHSIWIPALAHGSINAISGIGLYFMKYMNDGYLLGPALSGLISVLPLSLLALVIIYKSNKLGDLQ